MYLRHDVFYPKTETRLSDKELLSLKNRYDRFNAKEELNKISNFVFGKKIEKMEKVIAWGLDHILYRVEVDGKKYMFRLDTTSVGDNYFEVEKCVYDKLIEHKVQNCRVYAMYKRGDKQFLYDFIVIDDMGKPDFEKKIEKKIYSPQEELELVVKTGEFLNKFHSIPVKGFGFFDPEKATNGKLTGIKSSWKEYFETSMMKNIQEGFNLGFVTGDLVKRTEKVISKFTNYYDCKNPVLLHGDYCDHNIIIDDNNNISAIDLTDTMAGDYLHDIAFWLAFYDFDRLNFLLLGYYGSKSNFPDMYDLMIRLQLYLLRINYSKLILRYKYGIVEKVPLAVEKILSSLVYLENVVKSN